MKKMEKDTSKLCKAMIMHCILIEVLVIQVCTFVKNAILHALKT